MDGHNVGATSSWIVATFDFNQAMKPGHRQGGQKSC